MLGTLYEPETFVGMRRMWLSELEWSCVWDNLVRTFSYGMFWEITVRVGRILCL